MSFKELGLFVLVLILVAAFGIAMDSQNTLVPQPKPTTDWPAYYARHPELKTPQPAQPAPTQIAPKTVAKPAQPTSPAQPAPMWLEVVGNCQLIDQIRRLITVRINGLPAGATYTVDGLGAKGEKTLSNPTFVGIWNVGAPAPTVVHVNLPGGQVDVSASLSCRP